MSARLDDTVDDQTPANDSVADDLILMSLLLGRFAVRTGNLIEMELRALGDELVRVLTNNDFTETRMESARSQRLKRLLEESELALRSGFGAAGRILLRDTRFGIEVAGDHAAASLNDALGFERARAPDGDRVVGMAGALRVEGKTPTEWWKKLAGDAKFRYGRIIQDGYQRKLSLEDMVRAIRGTGAKLFNDGVLGPSWRAAAALARTAIAAGAALARTFVWADNQDIVGAILQTSILDLKTSDICRKYHRAAWSLPNYEPLGHGLPYNGGVPRHFGCRSLETPIVRPFADLPARVQTKIAFQHRESAFKGAEAADLSYQDWLRTQSVARQKAALGPRYNLWKAGDLALEDMLDPNGNPLSMRELRKLTGLA